MLFRQEVAQAKRLSWERSSVELDKLLPPLIPLLAALVAGALVLLCLTVRVPRKMLMSGHVEPRSGVAILSSPVQGTILSVGARDGQRVTPGQAIFEIGTDRKIGNDSAARRLTLAIEDQRRTLQHEMSIREQQLLQRQHAARTRISTLQAQKINAERELLLSRQRAEVTELEWQRNQELSRAGLITKAQVQQKELEHIEAKSRIESAIRLLSAIDLDIQGARADLEGQTSQLSSDIQNLRRSLASTDLADVETSIRSQTTMAAPLAGTLSLLQRHVGASVQANQTLATVIPATDVAPDGRIDFVAILYAPSRSIGFTKPGQAVAIKYHAFPYEKYGTDLGTVESISPAAIDIQDLPLAYQRIASQKGIDGEGYYKIVVRLQDTSPYRTGKRAPLRHGMTLEAEIRQDERYIWEWIFDPFLRAKAIL